MQSPPTACAGGSWLAELSFQVCGKSITPQEGPPRACARGNLGRLAQRITTVLAASWAAPSGTSQSAERKPLRALATGVPTTLCDRRRDLTIISRLPGRPAAADS